MRTATVSIADCQSTFSALLPLLFIAPSCIQLLLLLCFGYFLLLPLRLQLFLSSLAKVPITSINAY